MNSSIKNQTKKFASSFKPIFRACDLGTFCLTNRSERVEIEFLLKYKLFSKLKPLAFDSITKARATAAAVSTCVLFKPVDLKNNHKELIKRELASHLNTQNNLNFNDKQVLDKVNKIIFQDEPITTTKTLNDDELLIQALDEYEYQAKIKRIKLDDENDDDDQLLIQTLNKYEKEQEEKRIRIERYKEATKTFVSMQRGIQLEDLVMQRVNMLEGMSFVKSNKFMTKDFEYFKICGIVDGVDDEAKTIIEVKTKRHLSSNICGMNFSEHVQCLCYMSLLNFDKCILVESGPNGEQNLFRLVYDENEFKCKVLNRLKTFVEKYRNIEQDEFIELLRKYSYLL
jgi:hypothetical protein